jgi:hypothetical protein
MWAEEGLASQVPPHQLKGNEPGPELFHSEEHRMVSKNSGIQSQQQVSQKPVVQFVPPQDGHHSSEVIFITPQPGLPNHPTAYVTAPTKPVKESLFQQPWETNTITLFSADQTAPKETFSVQASWEE